jgi:hypothetical protein
MPLPPLSLFSALLAAFLLATAAFVGPGRAEEIDWKAGALGDLAPHIGTYRYDAVLGDPRVKAALETLVGADLAPTFTANLAVAGPIDFVGGHLVLRGNAPHRGGEEEALVLVKLYDGSVRAALLHAGRLTLFAPETRYSYLPAPLRDFARPRDGGASLRTAPPGVEWVREPRG